MGHVYDLKIKQRWLSEEGQIEERRKELISAVNEFYKMLSTLNTKPYFVLVSVDKDPDGDFTDLSIMSNIEDDSEITAVLMRAQSSVELAYGIFHDDEGNS